MLKIASHLLKMYLGWLIKISCLTSINQYGYCVNSNCSLPDYYSSLFIRYLSAAMLITLMLSMIKITSHIFTKKLDLIQCKAALAIIAWKVSKYGVIFGSYAPVFGLNTARYSVSLRIQSKYMKIWTRNSSVFGHFLRSE